MGVGGVYLPSDPVAQHGTLLLRNCARARARARVCVQYAAPSPRLQMPLASMYVFFFNPRCSGLVVFKLLLESSQLSCCSRDLQLPAEPHV